MEKERKASKENRGALIIASIVLIVLLFTGETKVDSEGNVQITTGSANAGSSLVWQVTVNNADKDAAKKMRNYTVNDILPEIYKFDANYLNDSYTGAKYYPSIVIYKKDGTVKKSWSGKDFILPSGSK